MSLLYNLIILLLSPAIILFFVWRIVGSRKSRDSWRQQLGILPARLKRTSDRPRIWLHAVSVGEAVASGSILREIRTLLPEAELIVSTTTSTGQEMVKRSLSEVDESIYFPLDVLPCVRKSLSTIEPDVIVCMESEIWPNFLTQAHRRGIPILIANGVVSDRTMRRSRYLRWIYRWALSGVQLLLMQSAVDAERIVQLGALLERTVVVGNCKFDQESDAVTENEISLIRVRYKVREGEPVLVAGSTNPGEDEPVLDAFLIARREHPSLRLIIAPRQIERADAIVEMAESRSLSSGRRSQSERMTGDEDVVVLDTFGELSTIYSIADVAFVGGSLIPKGGHNILQPIAQGKPVLFGPYTHKSRDLVRIVEGAGVGFEVADAEQFGKKVAALLSDNGTLQSIRKLALDAMAANRGASAKCAQAIVSQIARNGQH